MSNIKLNLTRCVSLTMHQEKTVLLIILNSFTFTLEEDSAIWVWEPTGSYTIKFLYNFLRFGGIQIQLSKSIWHLQTPLKSKLFLWMTLNIKN
jgi:hypothetical protein